MERTLEECKLGLLVDVELGRVVDCGAGKQDNVIMLSGIFPLFINPSHNHSLCSESEDTGFFRHEPAFPTPYI
jgi:hypothetical protein